MTKSLQLSGDFPKPNHDDWMAWVQTFLKGKAFESLIRETEDGIQKGPLRTASHTPENIALLARFPRDTSDTRPWTIAVPVEDSEISHANIQALEDLKGGASALRISVENGRVHDGQANGLKLRSASNIKRLFNEIHTNLIPITFAPSDNITDIYTALNGKQNLKQVRINLGLSNLEQMNDAKALINTLPEEWTLLTVNAAEIHDAGGSDCLELAYMAAKLTDFMRELGHEAVAKSVIIELAADQDGHQLIAKLRAARRICARIKESFGLSDTHVEIHTVTSKRMMQSIDPWSNFLRLTSAAFGAVCGGADTIMVRPFTQAVGRPTPFGHRTARNIQLLLMEESQLGLVQDPAFGSYYHEYLTHAIAEKSWKKFQEIETVGGIKHYINTGSLEKDLMAAQLKRESKADPVLGVTLHPTESGRPAKVRMAKS